MSEIREKATYTPAEVAKLIGRPPSTVYKWVDKGVLTHVMMGKQRLIPLAALKVHGLVWESIQLVNRSA